MSKRGLKPRVTGRQPNDLCPCGSTDKKINILKLHQLYENGQTLEILGKLIGVNRRTIKRWFDKYDLPIRNRSDRMKGILNPSFKEGPHVTKDGYIKIRKDDILILEHRAILENHLNRPLLKSEIVHHINGIKSDNRLENLKLVTHSSHRTEHKLPTEQWSYHYEKCIKCGTTDRKHAGHGMCTRCHQYVFIVNKRGYETEYREDGTRVFTDEHIEKLRNAAILRESRKKYKRCCGKGQKGTGTVPREGAKRKPKHELGETIHKVDKELQIEVMRRMLSGLRK